MSRYSDAPTDQQDMAHYNENLDGKNYILVKFSTWSKMCIMNYHYLRVKSLVKSLVKVRHHV